MRKGNRGTNTHGASRGRVSGYVAARPARNEDQIEQTDLRALPTALVAAGVMPEPCGFYAAALEYFRRWLDVLEQPRALVPIYIGIEPLFAPAA